MLRSRIYADNLITWSLKCVGMSNSAVPFAHRVISSAFAVAFMKVNTAVKLPTNVYTHADFVVMTNASLVVHRKYSCPQYGQ